MHAVTIVSLFSRRNCAESSGSRSLDQYRYRPPTPNRSPPEKT